MIRLPVSWEKGEGSPGQITPDKWTEPPSLERSVKDPLA